MKISVWIWVCIFIAMILGVGVNIGRMLSSDDVDTVYVIKRDTVEWIQGDVDCGVKPDHGSICIRDDSIVLDTNNPNYEILFCLGQSNMPTDYQMKLYEMDREYKKYLKNLKDFNDSLKHIKADSPTSQRFSSAFDYGYDYKVDTLKRLILKQN